MTALTTTQLLGKSSEWYTPPMVLSAARQVLGHIELDPASCEEANRRVQADRYFTQEQNGLAQEWKAETAWLNPPYGLVTGKAGGRSNIALFTTKMIAEYNAGNIGAAIMLVRADPGARWFHQFYQGIICFCRQDLMFERYNAPATRHRHGTAFIYLGPNVYSFADVFSSLGDVVEVFKWQ